MQTASRVTFLIRATLLLLVLFAADPLAAQAQEQPLRHVLFLNSYQQSMSWSQNILQAVYDELNPDQNNIVLHTFNMDTKLVFNQQYIEQLAAFLEVKFTGFDFDLIMASDNNAFDFLKNYRDRLFPEVPVVFCSVNNLDIEEVETLDGFTGVEEIFDAPATLELALKNHPDTKEVLIINDFLTSGRAVDAEIREQLRPYEPRLTLRSAENLSVEELNAQIRSLGPGTIVLIGAYYTDRDRQHVIGYQRMGPRLFAGATVPVYTLWSFHVHEGVIGGKVASGYQQGKEMARQAKQILQGTDANQLPIITSGTTAYIFNYPELVKHSIRIADLPEGSQIINQPVSVYRTYKVEIWIAIGFFVLLLVIICLLLISIHHRRLIAARLKENELKLKTVFNQTHEFISLLSPDGRILDINRPALDFWNLAKEEVIDKPFWDTPWWNHSAQAQQQLREKLREALSGKVVNFETTHPKEGALHTFEVTISPVFNDTGDVVFLIPEGRDISEQKTAEAAKEKLSEQLRQAQKLEAIGTLAGGIAHDFNNLLYAILGFCELNLINPNCKGKLHEHSEHIKAAALRGRDLVQQILTFCRKEVEKTELFQIHAVVQDALGLIQKTFPSSITIHADIDQDTGWVMADESQLHQIVMNLCTNALHAIDGNQGDIRISLKPVSLSADDTATGEPLKTGTYARLEISDSGRGMTREIRERIFDPFFTTKEQGKGTGLGLAVVHGIIQKLGGKIEVVSEVGHGATFTLWIPLSDANKETDTAPQKIIPEAINREHVLWVDDEEILANLGRDFLASLGYQVTATTSAREALDLFRNAPDRYQLLVTDQTMPDMSGLQLAQAIREIRPGVPVILCTGYSAAVDREAALSQGIRAFLMKPLRLETLAMEVRKQLGGGPLCDDSN